MDYSVTEVCPLHLTSSLSAFHLTRVPRQVTEEAVLTDPTGLHLAAGPYFLIYSRAVSEAEEGARADWPDDIKVRPSALPAFISRAGLTSSGVGLREAQQQDLLRAAPARDRRARRRPELAPLISLRPSHAVGAYHFLRYCRAAVERRADGHLRLRLILDSLTR